MGASVIRHWKSCARPARVPNFAMDLRDSEGVPVRTSKRQVPFFLSTVGSSQAKFPFLDESQKVLISGTWLPRAAGLGLATVRAQIQAMMFASRAPPSVHLAGIDYIRVDASQSPLSRWVTLTNQFRIIPNVSSQSPSIALAILLPPANLVNDHKD